MLARKLCVVLAMVGLIAGYCQWAQAQVPVPGTVTWATKDPNGKAVAYPVFTPPVPPNPQGSVTVYANHKANPGFTFAGAGLTVLNNAGGFAQQQPLDEANGVIGVKGAGGGIFPATFPLAPGNYTVLVGAVYVDKMGKAQPAVYSPPVVGKI
ncbi:MAG: hypothetical protein K2X82_07450 [Gemmataceae bacterium]|nr:hypothetical protein [Gemmataceae bacterium]